MTAASQPRWRMMTEQDLPAVFALSQVVHPAHPERCLVLQAKLALFGMGCFVLDGADGDLQGYGFSHPWRCGDVPALDTVLTRLPTAPDVYFIHDLALSAQIRGGGHGGRLLRVMLDLARLARFSQLELVSVGRSKPFWSRHGFRASAAAEIQAKVQAGYGADAQHMRRGIDRFFD